MKETRIAKTPDLDDFKIRLAGAFKANGGVLIALVVLYIIGGFLSPKFLTVNNQLSLLRKIGRAHV